MAPAPNSVVIAHTATGILGNIISFLLFLAPIPTFIKVLKWRSTKGYSGVPYVATLLNCMLWVFYGLPIVHPHSLLVVTINSAGAFMEIIYISIFVTYANKRQKIKEILMFVVVVFAVAIVVLLTMLLVHTHEDRTKVVGSMCVVIGICMYGSPLTIMVSVIKEKSVKYMPFHLSFILFLNGVVWTTYAIIRFDIFIALTNGVGALLGACQLILYTIYSRKKGVLEEVLGVKENQSTITEPPVVEIAELSPSANSLKDDDDDDEDLIRRHEGHHSTSNKQTNISPSLVIRVTSPTTNHNGEEPTLPNIIRS